MNLPALAIIAALASFPALAHDAPSGTPYPIICCSNHDCAPIAETDLEPTVEGFRVRQTGELIRYTSDKVKPSPDGQYHRCTYGGRPEALTRCILVPGGA